MNLKKLTAVLAVLVLCLSLLAGCGGDSPASTSDAGAEASESSAEPSTPDAADESSDIEYYDQDLDIINSTGVDIVELYISTSDDEMWGPDLLAGEVLKADETWRFTTDLVGTADATWDILIVDEDGDEIVFEEINFSSSTELELHWGADGLTPTVEMR